MKIKINSRKELVVFFGITIFIIITSFKLGSDYSVVGLKKPWSLVYHNGILYVANEDGFITILDKYGNILELEFINISRPSSMTLDKNKLVVASQEKLFFYTLRGDLVKEVDLEKNITQIIQYKNNLLVLLFGGDIIEVKNFKPFLFATLHQANSIAADDNLIFVAESHYIYVYNKGLHVIKEREFSVTIDNICFSDDILIATSEKGNIVFELDKNLNIVKKYKFERPSFAFYDNRKLFVSSKDYNKIYIKSDKL